LGVLAIDNDDVLPLKFVICNAIEASLKSTIQQLCLRYVEIDKSRHAIEWQIVDRSEAIFGNIEFDQRRRIVPVAIQRRSKAIAVEL
jgi:hypothetical protein